MRYFFEISYDGYNYHGWQNQANAVGVQQVVEKALSQILREDIAITGSGRTDTGVHCAQQFFHADISSVFIIDLLLIRLNSFLPDDIAIAAIFPVKPAAHARYDARKRSYEYTINRSKDPFLRDRAFYYFRPLDVALMNRAAALLIGTADFESFSKVKTDVNHFECTIIKAHWKKKDDLLVFSITANRFLRGMVRAIVGTLLDVGSGKITLDEFQEVILSKDRKRAGSNVPAKGLTLTSVTYTKKIYP